MSKRKFEQIVMPAQKQKRPLEFPPWLELLESATGLCVDVLGLIADYATWYHINPSTVPLFDHAINGSESQEWDNIGQYSTDGPIFLVDGRDFYQFTARGVLVDQRWIPAGDERHRSRVYVSNMVITATTVFLLLTVEQEIQAWDYRPCHRFRRRLVPAAVRDLAVTNEYVIVLTQYPGSIRVYDTELRYVRSWDLDINNGSNICVFDDQVWVAVRYDNFSYAQVYSLMGECLRKIPLEGSNYRFVHKMMPLDGTLIVLMGRAPRQLGVGHNIAQLSMEGKLLQDIAIANVDHICLVENHTLLLLPLREPPARMQIYPRLYQ